MILHSPALHTPPPSSSVISSVRQLTGMNAWVLGGVLAAVMTVLGYLYADSVRFLTQAWMEDDNYSHGPFIPLISLDLI